MKKILAVLEKIENGVIIVVFIVMTLAAFAQVINRNLIGAGISWFEELSRYSMVYMTMLATEVGLRDGSQIAISILTDRFKGLPRTLLDIAAKLIMVAFSLIVFVSSFTMIERQIATGQISPGMRLPMLYPYLAVTLSFGIISAVQIVSLVVLTASLFSGGKPSEGEAA